MVIVPFQWQNPNISPATLGLSACTGLHFWHLQKEFVIFFSGKLFFLFSPRCKAYLTFMPSINGRKWIKPYLIQYFSFLLVPKKIYRKRRHCFTFTRYANGEILASFWVRLFQGVKGLSKSILVHQGKRQIHAHVSNLRFHLTNLTSNLKRIATEKVLLGWLIQKNI